MELDYTFIKASIEDADEILRLYQSLIHTPFCAWTESYPSRSNIEDDLKRDALFLMRRENGALMGAISIDADENVDRLTCWSDQLKPAAELARLGVASDLQNQGIAPKLIEEVTNVCKRRGYKATHFLVAKANTKALKSYAKLNYERVGECHMYDCDYWCYEKEIK